jgi:hypothetical protein
MFSASPPTTDMRWLHHDDRFVPTTDVPMPSGGAIGSLCEGRMRGSRCSPLFHVRDGRLQIKIGKADTEIFCQHIAKRLTATNCATIHFARRIPNAKSRVEQGQSRSVWSGTRRDQVVEMWALWMSCSEPIANRVLGIDTGEERRPPCICAPSYFPAWTVAPTHLPSPQTA